MDDVIIIGGSYAGLAAALQLVRARRRVLIVDAGERRNRFARHSHGFLGQDGQPPDVIAAKGRAEVLAYPTARWLDAAATEACATADGFVVRAGGDEHQARRLILATGVVDELPAIPGLAEAWGTRAFFCPYCDGYEFNLGRLGVLATSEASIQYALLIAEWGQTTFFVNNAFEPTPEQLGALSSRQIAVERARIISVSGAQLHLGDGRTHTVDGLFLMPRVRLTGPFAEQLGCAVETGPLGPYYRTDEMKETTVPGVYACGDAARPTHAVSYAVGDGVRAGTAAHQSLVFRPPAGR